MISQTLTIMWEAAGTIDEYCIPLALDEEDATLLAGIVKLREWREGRSVWLELDHPIKITEINEEIQGLDGLAEELQKALMTLPGISHQILTGLGGLPQ